MDEGSWRRVRRCGGLEMLVDRHRGAASPQPSWPGTVHPQTEEDVAWVDATRRMIAEEPW